MVDSVLEVAHIHQCCELEAVERAIEQLGGGYTGRCLRIVAVLDRQNLRGYVASFVPVGAREDRRPQEVQTRRR